MLAPQTLAPLLHPPAAAAAAAPPSQDDLKRIAAHRAVALIESNSIIGLGTGSTAAHAITAIADLLRRGILHNITAIPTSLQTHRHAAALNIPLSDLDSHPIIDLSIDGADEVDPHLNLVKGRGGSLLREKMIETASKKFVVIVDESKMVPVLGASRLAVPVEVIPFCWKYTVGQLQQVFKEESGFEARLRTVEGSGSPAVTDNGNYVVDMYFEKGISGDLNEVSDRILRLTGVVEHGMFLGLATSVIVATKDGGVTVINK